MRKGTKLIRQRQDYDCGVACLAMLLDRPWGEVSGACRALYGKIPKSGLDLRQMARVGEAMGVTLVRKYRGGRC